MIPVDTVLINDANQEIADPPIASGGPDTGVMVADLDASVSVTDITFVA